MLLTTDPGKVTKWGKKSQIIQSNTQMWEGQYPAMTILKNILFHNEGFPEQHS